MMTLLECQALKAISGAACYRLLSAYFFIYAVLTIGLLVPVAVIASASDVPRDAGDSWSTDMQAWAALLGLPVAAISSLRLRERDSQRDVLLAVLFLMLASLAGRGRDVRSALTDMIVSRGEH